MAPTTRHTIWTPTYPRANDTSSHDPHDYHIMFTNVSHNYSCALTALELPPVAGGEAKGNAPPLISPPASGCANLNSSNASNTASEHQNTTKPPLKWT